MKKTFLANDFVRSLRFLEHPPALRGFTLALHSYCAERETGGVIYGAAEFTGPMWRGLLGRGGNRSTIDAMEPAGLVRWRGGDLEIVGYDAEAEEKYRGKRDAGKAGGIASGESRRETKEKGERFPTDDPSTASTTPSSTPVREGRGKEGRGEDGVGRMSESEGSVPPSTDPAGIWTAADWKRQFEAPWLARYGGLAMGGGVSAAKATGDLADQLASLPDADRLAAQERAPQMFAEFLNDESPQIASARHPWSWFVTRFDGLRVPKAKPAPRREPQRTRGGLRILG
ncbi:MAG TPA: hypothetical protein VHK47_11400 [Polyangia bacterium]|nr:hypothetical protein [Polyangia bacterium]